MTKKRRPKRVKIPTLSQAAKARRNRRDFIAMYGGKCALCDESDAKVLTLDHVQGDGAAERGRTKSRQGRWKYNADHCVRKALRRFQPDRYRILCQNCNVRSAWDNGLFSGKGRSAPSAPPPTHKQLSLLAPDEKQPPPPAAAAE